MIDIELKGDFGFEITLAEIMGYVKLHENKEINFVVSSYGGFVDEAMRIYEYLKNQNNISVTFKGICASATTFAFLSIPKEKRKAYKGTQFAIHLPYNSYMFTDMNVEDLEQEAERLKVWTNKVNSIYENHLNISREEIENIMSPDSWFSAEASQGLGFISEVLEFTEETTEDFYLDMVVFNKFEAQNKICAFVKKNINLKTKNNMSNEKLEKLEKDVNLLTKFMNMIRTPKNLLISSEEGVDIDFSGEEVAVGVTTSDVPDETYTITYAEKKWKVTIVDNVVTELEEIVVEEVNEEVENLKKENESLKKEIETLKQTANRISEIENKLKDLENLKTEAQNFVKDKKEIQKPNASYLERRKKVIENKNK